MARKLFQGYFMPRGYGVVLVVRSVFTFVRLFLSYIFSRSNRIRMILNKFIWPIVVVLKVPEMNNTDICSKVLFTNPSARAGYDTWSIFKRSLTGLTSEFSFS